MDEQPISQFTWSATRTEFRSAAGEVGDEAACCVFVIDDEIPRGARPGYSQLVIAYTRADEPVTIDPDGTASLLIREGGVAAARVAAERIFGQMRRLALEGTLRAGIAAVGGDVDAAIGAARAAAVSGQAGAISVVA